MTEQKRPRKKPVRSRLSLRTGPKLGVNFVKKHVTAVATRPDHYYMLREMADFYDAPLTKIVGALIVQEYCRVLSFSDPERADKIKSSYATAEEHAQYIIKLAD